MNKLFSILFIVFLASFVTSAQTPTAWGYNTGYGQVYGSFGLAQTMQSMYNVARSQQLKTKATNSDTKRSEKGQPRGESKRSAAKAVTPAATVVRNYGRFRPDSSIDTGASLADALGETADEKALIKNIYITTKAAYDKEAEAKGWANNVAGGLTLFTATAVTVYRDIEEPSPETLAAYFGVMNAALDETPEFATVENKNKQGFNNMLIGFSGILIATYLDAKQNKNATSLANAKKLAGMMIEMILKTDPENILIENGQIVMK